MDQSTSHACNPVTNSPPSHLHRHSIPKNQNRFPRTRFNTRNFREWVRYGWLGATMSGWCWATRDFVGEATSVGDTRGVEAAQSEWLRLICRGVSYAEVLRDTWRIIDICVMSRAWLGQVIGWAARTSASVGVGIRDDSVTQTTRSNGTIIGHKRVKQTTNSNGADMRNECARRMSKLGGSGIQHIGRDRTRECGTPMMRGDARLPTRLRLVTKPRARS
jgi:hypothetical protein